ncbi:MAG TPA: hypothetical protein VFI00_03365 [Kribbella sp.]|nr:hypothetical protein [Kribbella sp.]
MTVALLALAIGALAIDRVRDAVTWLLVLFGGGLLDRRSCLNSVA